MSAPTSAARWARARSWTAASPVRGTAGRIALRTASRRRRSPSASRPIGCPSWSAVSCSTPSRCRRAPRSSRLASRSESMSHVPSDEFFIGWLPVPRGYVRFLIPIVLLLVLLGAGVAGLLAALQRDPGTGQWEDGEVATFDGIAYARPYAMLHVPGKPARMFLLVEEGKFGALERVEKLVGASK